MDCSEDNVEMAHLTPMMLPNESSPAHSKAEAVRPYSDKDQDEAQVVAQNFCKTYYDTVQEEATLSQLYLDTPVMIWNGKHVLSQDDIQKFFEQIPSLTFHLMAWDCQQLSALAVGSRKTFLIKAAGLYRISGTGCQKQFSQDIVLTAVGNKWRIAVDEFRTKCAPGEA